MSHVAETPVPGVGELMQIIQEWPAEKRLDLACRVLSTLQGDLSRASDRRFTLEDLRGLIPYEGPRLTDDDFQSILEEEIMKKHGQ